ncbi:biotin--[acetyl-CoA-carboxylase] ligase [Paenibacillus sp. TRM 82003]|nr:biotin--[acetyl-CoA-carboxylase] ligase [Paenibacillus sp. TRM 82003]
MNDRLLACFLEAPGAFVSGEQLSRALGVSRTAVWKRIRKLEEEGYVFESVSRVGYKLVSAPERFRLDELLPRLTGTPPFGENVKLYETVASTQDVAHEAMLAGAPEGTLVLAERQLTGRGRFGRVWHSPLGKGIYMSFLLRPQLPLAQAAQMTLLLSVALCRAIRRETGAEATIKWPNDLLIEGRKISGILVESIAEADTVVAMIAGVGISVNLTRNDFPEELREKATSLFEATGAPVSREALVGAFFEQFAALYSLYRTEGFGPIKGLWEALSSTLDGQVEVATPRGPVRGVAEGITAEGALLVKDADGRTHTLYSGDLTFPERPNAER